MSQGGGKGPENFESTKEPAVDKENEHPGQHKLNLTEDLRFTEINKKDAKGILKNNHTIQIVSSTQRPLREVGETMSKKSYRRRVSFAPEVTLHKIDLAPQSQLEVEQSKRRQTIAFTPRQSAPRFDIAQTVADFTGSPTKSKISSASDIYDDENDDEIQYDSSDMELDTGSQIYSSPKRRSSVGIKSQNNGDGYESDNYTDTVDMSITKPFHESFDMDEDNTMDLTKQLGGIRIEQHPEFNDLNFNSSNDGDEEEKEKIQQEETPKSLFGSIKSLFSTDDNETGNHNENHDDQEEQEEVSKTQSQEEDMELTQSVQTSNTNIISIAPDEEQLKQREQIAEDREEEEEGEEDDSQEYYDSESAMDITSLAEDPEDKITLMNTRWNREMINLPDSELEISMEQTQPISTVKVVNEENKVEIPDEEVTMDETKLMSLTRLVTQEPAETEREATASPAVTPQGAQIIETSEKINITPLKGTRSHTSETGSPMSSKRKSLITENIETTNDLREKINLMTPNKKRRLENTRNSIIPLRQQQLEHENDQPLMTSTQNSQPLEPSLESVTATSNKKFTPLRTSANIRRLTEKDKVEFKISTEKAPLAPEDESEALLRQNNSNGNYEYQPVTLNQFLSDLSIEFFDGINLKDNSIKPFETVSNQDDIKPVDYLIARYSKLPKLELYKFSCEELQKNMSELKKLFDDLDVEFSEENPQLVKDYYETQDFIQQKKMSDSLLLLKTISDKESEVSWSSWRNKLLDELLIRFENNFAKLQQDSKVYSDSIDFFNEFKAEVSNNIVNVNNKIQEYIEIKQQTNENEKVNELRGEFIDSINLYVSQVDELKELEEEIRVLDKEVAEVDELQSEIDKQESYIEVNNEPVEIRVLHSLEIFSKLQLITGYKFIKMSDSRLTMEIQSNSIQVEFDLLSPKQDRKVVFTKKLTNKFLIDYFNDFLLRIEDLEILDYLKSLSKISSNLVLLDKEIFFLQLKYQAVIEKREKDLIIRLQEFSREFKYKVEYQLTLNEETIFQDLKADIVNATVYYGNVDDNVLLDSFNEKAEWINRIGRINVVRS